MIVRRIGPLSIAKIFGLLYCMIGLVAGCFFALIAVVGGLAGTETSGPYGAMFGVGAVVLLPIVYGGIGFLGTLLMATLYNLIASWLGGIELQVDPMPEAGPPQSL